MAALVGLALIVTVAQSGELETLAEEAGVTPVELAGAVNSTGQGPREYLIGVGEMPPATQRTYPPPVERPSGVWDRLAACESSGNWHSASNPKYKGGVQMDAIFWARYGGTVFASRADYASREQQIIVAERGLESQGWCAWPTCAVRLGLAKRC